MTSVLNRRTEKHPRGADDGWGRPRHAGVAGRLVVLVLLPLVGISVLSAPLVLRTSRDAQRAQAVDDRVPQLTHVLGALTAVVAEQSTDPGHSYALRAASRPRW